MTRITSMLALSAALILSAGGLLATTAFAKTPPPVVINEFASGSSHDWVELYNTTRAPIDLSGWELTNNSVSGPIYTFSAGTTLNPHGFVAVGVADHLKNKGDLISLLGNTGSATTTIDSVAYGNVPGYVVAAPTALQSAYRIPDGGTTWALTSTPTQGTSNTPVEDITQRTYFQTLQAAIASSTTMAGDTIRINSGTTTGSVTISKPLTIEGRNHAGFSSEVTVDAPDVTIEGMTITNPTGSNGVVVNDVNHVTIKHNVFYGIGNSFAGPDAIQAINIQKTSSDIVIDRNTFTNIGESMNFSSNKAVYIGDSNGGSSSDVSITHNVINGVVANQSAWGSGGHGAYGILVNHEVRNLVVTGNAISNLNGLWAHAVGLEADTPGAVVAHNSVRNLTDHKTPSDAVAFRFESNPGALTTTMASDRYDGHAASNATTTVVVDSSWATLSASSNTYPEVLYGGKYYYYGINAFATIQAGLDAVAPGGTVYVAPGDYTTDLTFAKNGVSLIGAGRNKVQITSDGTQPYGIYLDGAKNVTLRNFTFTVSSTDARINYALHADQADGLTIKSAYFKGVTKNAAGKTVGGVDLNTTSNAALSGVTADGFGKNGFSFLSIYAKGEMPANNVTFNNTTAMHNGWAGYAFYTVGDDHSTDSHPSTGPAASITGVQFTGTNRAYYDGAEGVQVEGDSDANVAAQATPKYTVTTDGKTLDLSHVNFKGNGMDIVNYQTTPANAIGAKFSGRTGNTMTAAQRTAEDKLIYDHLDLAALGLVHYYGAVTTDAATNITATDATLNGTNGPLAATRHSFWVSTSTIDTSSINIPKGVYSTPSLGKVGANASFDAPLSLVTTQGVTTNGVHKNMPAITPNTTYYYVAWSYVNGQWYHGMQQHFTTAPAPKVTTDAASAITVTSATLHGTNGPSIGEKTSFWWGTTPIKPLVPSAAPDFEWPGTTWVHDPVLENVAPGTAFSSPLTGLATSTTYYYVAWARVGGVWYPGQVESFTTKAAPKVTTGAATAITPTDALLNGTNGPLAADKHSFWVSTSTIDTSSTNMPNGVYSTPGLGNVAENASFDAPLSLVTTQGVTTNGVHKNMPAITPNTTYYYVAWSYVNGQWYHGDVRSFATKSNPGSPSLSITAPAANGDYATSTYDFTATYDNGTKSSLAWAIHPNASCTGPRTASNIAPQHDGGSLTGTQYSVVLNTAKWSDGTYCFAVDAGNGLRVTRSFKVDNTGPTVPTIVSPTNGEATTTAAFAQVAWTPVAGAGVTYIYQSAYGSDATTSMGAFVHPKWTTPAPISETFVKTNIHNTGTYYFHVRAVNAGGVLSDWSSIVAVHVYTTMPVTYTYTYATTTVRAADLAGLAIDPTKWFFWSVNNNYLDNTLGSFVTGPSTPPTGTGSAQIVTNTGHNVALATNALNGISLADITKLSYATYLQDAAIDASYSLAFDVTTGGAAPTSGVLTYTPGLYTPHTWQKWNAATSSAAEWSFSNAGSNGCSVVSPCTWEDLIKTYPNMVIDGKTYLEAMPQVARFVGNVDDFVVGVKSGTSINQVTYDFEPTPVAPASGGTSSGGGGGAGAGLVGDLNHDGHVNFVDYAILMAQMGKHATSLSHDLSGDLNNDLKVNLSDLAILLSHWTG